jgi:hypothetical protein
LLLVVGSAAIRTGTLACTSTGRGKMIAKVSRLWRWEFWPSWLFYLPVLPWLAYLSLRYGRVLTWTAANPGIPHGGVVGESKHAILAQLPQEWVIPVSWFPPENPAPGWIRFDGCSNSMAGDFHWSSSRTSLNAALESGGSAT